ncbi:AfsA-related hotdog domain-containing protein [Marinactinospora rubrisoli]|uniref:AfsA-related hotdog domain-containing protein n=1 Tax=Marinactinospora rubrisoli TaxID=2715399 RepID=A0ABW2KQA2_9ACTN
MTTLTSPPVTEAAPAAEQPPALGYDRTVPRGLVHRWALSEVFLTDSRRVDETRFTSAAQLPPSHAYFGDHLEHPRWYDTLLVLESSRQAVTHAAHVHQEVPTATTFMVTSWSVELTDPGALAHGERPGRLRIDGDVTGRRVRGGRLRRLVFEMGLELDDRPLGRIAMDVSATPTDQYHRLRAMQRGGPVPTAFTLPAEPAGTPLPPAEAGRRDPVNVVLDGVRRSDEGLAARLSPRSFRNRSMYDHPYDHVPAMVFSEAARQCALLLAEDAGPDRVVRLDGEFRKFAELDAPVELTAGAAPAGAPAGGHRMTAVQQGEVVAEVTVVLG